MGKSSWPLRAATVAGIAGAVIAAGAVGAAPVQAQTRITIPGAGPLYYPNLLWHRFGLLLGGIIAPIVMALVYITTVVPIGLIARLLGKDILHLEGDEKAESYWIDRTSPPQPMKNQF